MAKSIHHAFVERYGVPAGWNAMRLRELVSFLGGGTPDSDVSAFWGGDIPWLTPTEMTTIEGRFASNSERTLTRAGLESARCSLLEPGTLVMSTRGTVGNVVIAGVPLTCNQSCEALVPKESASSDYLYFVLTYWRPLIERMAAGTTFKSITRRDIRDLWFSVPDVDERDQITNALIAVEDAIAAAGEELTAAIRIRTALMQQLFTKGIPGRSKSVQTIVVFRKPVDIPKRWEPSRLGASTVLVQYGTNAASNGYRGGYPVIAIPEVVALRLELGDVPYADIPESEARDLRLEENDVLLIRTNGNPAYMGKSTLITADVARQHVVFASYLIRVRTDQDRLRGAYLNYFLASPLGRRQALAMANTSAGNHNLGARSLRQFWIPRPDPDEQDEIVTILHRCEDAIDALQDKVEALLRLKKSLLQNLLTGKVRVAKGVTV